MTSFYKTMKANISMVGLIKIKIIVKENLTQDHCNIKIT